ncbi:MAG: GNAT family N-acetyltransferase [Anaerolineales bacterium]|nr:GNAT family N-acetyltransferase [Anaerolineales bacterium]MCW5856013.1 GNAT family N-acetyltransferase [Anaerolineales bacterium]
MPIEYKINLPLDLEAFIGVYRASSLGERRPVAEPQRMQRMLDEADLTVSAWDGARLVGLARSLTDWAYCCYLADLTVADSHQRLGIGKELIRQTQAALEPGAMLVLLAAPAAADYYPRIGMEKHPSAWILRPGEKI